MKPRMREADTLRPCRSSCRRLVGSAWLKSLLKLSSARLRRTMSTISVCLGPAAASSSSWSSSAGHFCGHSRFATATTSAASFSLTKSCSSSTGRVWLITICKNRPLTSSRASCGADSHRVSKKPCRHQSAQCRTITSSAPHEPKAARANAALSSRSRTSSRNRCACCRSDVDDCGAWTTARAWRRGGRSSSAI